jgi:hypothetical protein
LKNLEKLPSARDTDRVISYGRRE